MAGNEEQTKPLFDELLLALPGVKTGKMFGHVGYKVNGKMFAFLVDGGIALKLPENEVKTLIESNEHIIPFEPGRGIVWDSWAVIQHDNLDDFRNDQALYEQSINFAGQG